MTFKSPCVGLCSTTYGDTVCRGCKRMLSEVIEWNALTPDQREGILSRLMIDAVNIAKHYIQITDEALLKSKCQRYEIKHRDNEDPLMWAYRLMQKGMDKIKDINKYGIAILPAYQDLSLPKLFERMDDELYVKASAYYDANSVEDVLAWQHRIQAQPNLMQQWLSKAKQSPKQLAVADTLGVELSNKKLLIAVKLMQDQLCDQLKDESRVGLCLPTSAAGVMSLLTLFSLGKTIVPVNYTASAETVADCLARADVNIVLTSQHFVENVKQRGFDPAKAFAGKTIILLEDIKANISRLAKLKALWRISHASVEQLQTQMLASVKSGDTAVILFSSGSEGQPKGVELSYFNLLSNIKQVAVVLEAKPHDAMVGILPLFHAFGLTINLLLPLVEGAPVICHPDPRDALAIGKLVQKYQGTIFAGTSTFYRLYIKSRSVKPEMFASLRYVCAGAEKLQTEVAEQFFEKFGKVIHEGYGTTELSPVASVNRPDAHDRVRHKVGTIGQALIGTRFRIVEPQTHQVLPVGKSGMIAVGGAQVMKGYLNDPEKTQQVIFEDQGVRWYLTGDKGRIDADGFVTILDRYSRFIKVGGEMVSLAGVEYEIKAILNDPELEILAVGVADAKKGESIVLLIEGVCDVARIKQSIQHSAILNLLKPQHYFVINSIPKLGTGKTDFAGAKALAQSLV